MRALTADGFVEYVRVGSREAASGETMPARYGGGAILLGAGLSAR